VRARSGLAAGEPRHAVELAAFAALGAVVLLHWSQLIESPPAGRLLLVLAVTTATAAAIGRTGRMRLPRPVKGIALAVLAVAGTAGALLAIGIQGRLLLPANWGELSANLGDGFAGVEQAELPYRGEDVWLRQALMFVAPAMLAVAAALAFWPGDRRERRRLIALVVLVAAYGIAVTLDSPAAELLWGLIMLALIAFWMWGPRLTAARGSAAAATVATAGVLALPAAAALDPETPWWDYERWSWFGTEPTVTFDWNHGYGPLDWPQEGTTLLRVHASAPLYWKTTVLDRFDGFTWQRARESDIYAGPELAARRSVPGADLAERNDDWLRQVSFDINGLSSPFVVAAATTQGVQGLDRTAVSADGTVSKFGAPVEAGAEYSIVTYAPDPTVERLHAAPRTYSRGFRDQLLVGLPAAGPAVPGSDVVVGSLDPVPGTPMAPWGTTDPAAASAAESSAYAGVYRLAHRLVADASTPYDAVIAIQRHLHRNFIYDPEVRRQTYALSSFLLEGRAGYCQHFSGAMALMLRMVGIPSRVVAGFAPGTLDPERDLFTVHDTDAHSWVEVYFRGIGWVTFDPTPAASPAISQSLNELAAFRGVDPARTEARVRRQAREARATTRATPGSDSAAAGGAVPWGAIGLSTLAVTGVASGAYLLAAWRRRQAFLAAGSGDAQLDELLVALRRLGWGLPPQATLLGLERRFRTAGRTAVAGYAAGLRAHRYEPGGRPPPGPAARRELRRALSGGAGLGKRLRGLAAIPLGGPAAKRRP
jgi:transglutaminase-like putative cysteine protease